MIPKKILVCMDFSENSMPAQASAVEYAKAFKAELLILHVVNSRLLGYPTLEDRIPVDMGLLKKNIEEGVRQELDLIVKDCKSELKRVRAFFRTGAPAEEIARAVEEESVGLVIMGTHGWSGLKHLVLGSTAENVVRTANCPVLTVRSGSKKQVEP
jgi:nucleotide-binding universal stress UspA family protein